MSSYSQLLTLAWPLVLSTAAHSAMLFTDRLFLSRLGPEAMAASFPAGVTAYLGACFFATAAGFTATFAAQHTGAGEHRACGPSAWCGLQVAAIGALANLAAIPFLPALFGLIGAEPAVHAHMVTLASWLLANAGGVAAIAAVGGYFAGTGRPRVVLALNLALVALNAVLNAGLIFGLGPLPRLGVAGSSIGTFIATTVVAAVALALLLRRSERQSHATWPPPVSRAALRRFLAFAAPHGGRQLIDIGSWTWFAFAVGSFGTAALAANNVIITWNLLTFIPMVGLGQAIGVAVGQSLGAGDLAGARAAARHGVRLQLAYGAAVAAAYVLASGPMIDAFVTGNDAEAARIRAIAERLLVVAALWNLGDALNMGCTGALGGAGDTRWPFAVGSAGAVVLLVIPLAVIASVDDARWAAWGMEAVVAAWLASLAYVTAIGGIMAWRWRSGAWARLSLRGGPDAAQRA